MKRKPLGRGLDALLPKIKEDETASIHEIQLDNIIKSRFQPRENFDDERIQQLSESIRKNGIIQPVVVRKFKDKYELIVGERRLRAARMANLKKIPAIIKELSDNRILITALIENIQRDDLDPLEIAKAIKKLILDYKLTHQQVAENIGRDRTTVTNYLRILNLPVEIKKNLEEGKITLGHARALLSLEDSNVQKRICDEVINKNLSVRQTENLIRNILDKKVKNKKKVLRRVDPLMKETEDFLRKKLATKVRVSPIRNKKGKIEIEYYSEEHLQELLDFFMPGS